MEKNKTALWRNPGDISEFVGGERIRKAPISLYDGIKISYYAIPSIQLQSEKKYLTFLGAFYVISMHYEISIDQIKSKSRKRDYVLPRHLMCYFLCKYGGQTLSSTGTALNRDHASVLHGKKAIANLSSTDHVFRNKLEQIEVDITKTIYSDETDN